MSGRNAAQPEPQDRPTWTLALVLPALAALAILIIYVRRCGLELPLYAGDESTYLIRARFAGLLDADVARYPLLADIDNTVFLNLLRGLDRLTPTLLGAARVTGSLSYFAGLGLVWWAVRRDLSVDAGRAFLLLALIFPYHRFVFTALPEGWYVGVLGLMVLATARLHGPRPLVHALVMGGLAAVLVLIKPHGVALVVAFVGLALVDAALDPRRDARGLAARVAVFALSFLAAGNLVQVLDAKTSATPLLFFGNGFYAGILAAPVTGQSLLLGFKALLALGSSMVLIAGVPILAGLADMVRRRREASEGLALTPTERVFLLLLLSLGATAVMVAIFALKIGEVAPGESNRLWGRYFEFFAPMLWLAAAPAILRWEGIADRRVRIAAAATVLLGLAGLTASLLAGVMLFPWDASALSAFFRPDRSRWPMDAPYPLFPLAVAATLVVAGLTVTRLRTVWIWQGYFVALALLSTSLDEAWVNFIAPQREALALELGGARVLTAPPHGPVGAYFDDPQAALPLFLRLDGRPRMIGLLAGAPLHTDSFEAYQTVVVQGDHPVQGSGWELVQPGLHLKVYRRDP